MVESAVASDAALPLPLAAAALVAWRSSGQLHVTVIAKATFAFAPDADMARVEPQAILSAEVHHGNNPARSVRFTGDLAPYLARADVLFTGHVHAYPPCPPGPAQAARARLGLFRGEVAILDKTILVRDGVGFQRKPIIYEHAFGGPNVVDNPLGVGGTPGDGEPTLFDPKDPRRPAGFGPIARAWPARKRLLGETPRRVLEGPVAEIPTPFDWSYFQAAPLDQRTDFLRGDEWIMLEGLHPTLPLLRTRLPGVRATARIHGLSAFGVAEGTALDLHLDTLRIDGDEQRCTAVFRRSFPVAGEAALAAVRAVAGVQVRGEALAWFEPRPSGAARVDPRGAAAPASSEGTVALPLDDALGESSPGARPALPFVPPVPVEPLGTLAISLEDDQAPRGPALPFGGGVATGSFLAASPRPAAEIPAHVATGTLAIAPDEEALAPSGSTLPFAARRAPPPAPPPPEPPPPESLEPAPFWPGVAEPAWLGSLATPAPAPPPVPELDTVPYFAPPAAASPAPPVVPEPRAPAIDPASFPLERYAALAAELAEQRAPRDDVLGAQGLDEPAWSAIDRHWSEAIRRDAKHAAGKLRRAYDAAYVSTVEGLRGPITPAEYARLALAGERGVSDQVLDNLRIQRPARMSVIRVWAQRLAADARLRGEVGAARARLLAE
jgi:hypothetical protein